MPLFQFTEAAHITHIVLLPGMGNKPNLQTLLKATGPYPSNCGCHKRQRRLRNSPRLKTLKKHDNLIQCVRSWMGTGELNFYEVQYLEQIENLKMDCRVNKRTSVLISLTDNCTCVIIPCYIRSCSYSYE